jgi:hypothetical protein
MLRGILRETVQSEADMTVVRELRDETMVAAVAQESDADVVVVASAHDGLCEDVLLAAPTLGVLHVRGDGRDVLLCELRLQTTELGELVSESLLSGIRRCRPARGDRAGGHRLEGHRG